MMAEMEQAWVMEEDYPPSRNIHLPPLHEHEMNFYGVKSPGL